MALAHANHITYEQYLELRKESDERLEYIDGIVCMSPAPSTMHQRISGRLHARLFNYLEGKTCEVFAAPFDIVLSRDDIEGVRNVIPDLTVICDPSSLTDTKYIGVPSLIVEILSPSNQSYDLVTKLNLYMRYGVKEYWIVNPMLRTIMVYNLNEEGLYEQRDIKVETGLMKSLVLETFEVRVEDLFK